MSYDIQEIAAYIPALPSEASWDSFVKVSASASPSSVFPASSTPSLYPTEDLLKKLCFPEEHVAENNKGTLTWQQNPHPLRDENSPNINIREALPVAASLVISDKTIRIKVFNIDPSVELTTTLFAEWSIAGESPELRKYIFSGKNMMPAIKGPDGAEELEKLVTVFSDLIPIFEQPPELKDIGPRKIFSSQASQRRSQTR